MNQLPAFFIVGLGSQASAWALNLRSSGLDVTIGLRQGSPSWEKLKKLELKGAALEEDFFTKPHALIALLIPDHEIPAFFDKYQKNFRGDESFLLAHGASYFEVIQKYPRLKIGLLAPKAIASELRFRYETHGALGAVIARGTLDEATYAKLPALSKSLGINVGPFEVTLKEETHADLFSEQALLCGLLPYAFRASFELLKAKGIPEELAFMECWVEGQLIANTLCEKGPDAFFNLISPNALLGAQKASNILIDENFKNKLEDIWSDIDSGKFLEEAAQINVSELRKKVLSDWEQSPLSKTFNRLQNNFYPTTKG